MGLGMAEFVQLHADVPESCKKSAAYLGVYKRCECKSNMQRPCYERCGDGPAVMIWASNVKESAWLLGPKEKLGSLEAEMWVYSDKPLELVTERWTLRKDEDRRDHEELSLNVCRSDIGASVNVARSTSDAATRASMTDLLQLTIDECLKVHIDERELKRRRAQTHKRAALAEHHNLDTSFGAFCRSANNRAVFAT